MTDWRPNIFEKLPFLAYVLHSIAPIPFIESSWNLVWIFHQLSSSTYQTGFFISCIFLIWQPSLFQLFNAIVRNRFFCGNYFKRIDQSSWYLVCECAKTDTSTHQNLGQPDPIWLTGGHLGSSKLEVFPRNFQN